MFLILRSTNLKRYLIVLSRYEKNLSNAPSSFLLIAFTLSTTFTLYAQEPEPRGVITGTVLDRVTQSPLIGATISIPGTTRGAVAKIDGSFRIAGLTPGTYRIQVSSLGYEPIIITDIEVTNARPQSVRVELNETQTDGETVVVRPDYFQQRRTSASSTRELDAEEIRRLPGGFEDVVRAISTLPA